MSLLDCIGFTDSKSEADNFYLIHHLRMDRSQLEPVQKPADVKRAASLLALPAHEVDSAVSRNYSESTRQPPTAQPCGLQGGA
jgi:hypothetical protein